MIAESWDIDICLINWSLLSIGAPLSGNARAFGAKLLLKPHIVYFISGQGWWYRYWPGPRISRYSFTYLFSRQLLIGIARKASSFYQMNIYASVLFSLSTIAQASFAASFAPRFSLPQEAYSGGLIYSRCSSLSGSSFSFILPRHIALIAYFAAGFIAPPLYIQLHQSHFFSPQLPCTAISTTFTVYKAFPYSPRTIMP